jgi:hypothetical protein
MNDNTICEKYIEDVHLWNIGTIVHCHHFVLVAMYLLDTLLQCVL